MDTPAPRRRSLWILASALPVLLVAGYIAGFGLDLPYWDQWELVPYLLQDQQGTLQLTDLAAQHNEHRPLFPRLLWLALARATAYNTNAELWLNLGLTVLTFTLFAAQARRAAQAEGVTLPGYLLPLLALLIFNLAQWETWLLGFQTVMVLGVLSVLAGFVVLARRTDWLGLGAGVILGGIATFSMANALLYWPLGLGLVCLASPPSRRLLRGLAWTVACLLVLGVFFWNWQSTQHASLPAALGQPLVSGNWVLNFLGAPLLAHRLAWLPGLCSLALAGWVALHARATGRIPVHVLPSLALLLFFWGSGLAIGVGRSNLPLDTSIASRYLTQTAWYWAALLLLLSLYRFRYQRALHTLILALLLVNCAFGARRGYHYRYLRTLPIYQAVQQGIPLTDAQIDLIYTPRESTRLRLAQLCQNHWSACRDQN